MTTTTMDDVLSVSEVNLLACYVTSRYRLAEVQIHCIREQSQVKYSVSGNDEVQILITIDLITARLWIARQIWSNRMGL